MIDIDKRKKETETKLKSLYENWLEETNRGHYKEYADQVFNLKECYKKVTADEQIKSIFLHYDIPLTGRLLEVGCSNGRFLFHFSQGEEFEICVGIDLDKTAIDMANSYKQYQNIEDEKMVFKVASIHDIPFPDNYFNIILFKDVGEHLGTYENFLSAIKELKRILKPEGNVFMETPNYFFPLEVHLKIPMIPYVASKKITKIIANICNKNSSFIDHLFFITPRKANKAYEQYFSDIKNIYVDYKVNSILEAPEFLSKRYGFLISLIKLIKLLKLSGMFKILLKLTGLYPTLWYIVKKN